MTIDEIIGKYYEKLKSYASKCDKHIYCGYTQEDIFHNTLMYAMRKYKDKDLDENEGFRTVRKMIKTEIKFAYRKKDRDILTFINQE